MQTEIKRRKEKQIQHRGLLHTLRSQNCLYHKDQAGPEPMCLVKNIYNPLRPYK